MTDKLLPTGIYAYLAEKVLGQDQVLKQIAVSVYKHLNGVKWGNVLLIGNSGTGKTTIMNAVTDFYREHPDLDKYQAMSVMNANTLVDEAGDVKLHRIFKDLEAGIRNRLGDDISARELQTRIENATVCLDEIDKISARISGRVNVSGILIQQALLTILEGETIYLETTVFQEGKKRAVRIPVNTARMLFICGGAFEELYDQVHLLVQSGQDGRKLKETYVFDEATQRPERRVVFTLKEYMTLDDLFDYGMAPQFISRFSAIALLENLKKETLKHILLHATDSPFVNAKAYFATLGIDLRISEDALDWIAAHAEKHTRIGARALREVFSRVIADLQFDPFGSGRLTTEDGQQVLLVDRDMLAKNSK